MRRLWIVSVGCILFFSGDAAAQEETKFVDLKSCDEQITIHDPTILSRKTVKNVKNGCREGYPVRVVMVDTRFGIEAPTKTLFGTHASVRVIDPSPEEAIAGYKRCPLAFRRDNHESVGVIIEWSVRENDVCDGRPSSIFRVYTPDNKVCLVAGSRTSCVKVDELRLEGRRRFHEVIDNAYPREHAMR